MKRKYIGVDIFAGAGGLSVGAEMAGISVELAVESNRDAALTYRKNHQYSEVIENDICDIELSQFIEKKPFIVFGGPPCQGFSTSNTKTRNLKNSKNYLFQEFVRVVQELKPDWFVFENVEGFKFFEKGKVAKWLAASFTGGDTTYIVKESILSANNYGVPQNRKRYFMVGNKHGWDFEFPEPSSKTISVNEAINDLPKLKNGDKKFKLPYRKVKLSDYAKLMRKNSKLALQNDVSTNRDYVIERYSYIKPGQNWKAIPESLMQNYTNRKNCHSGIYRRLNPQEPACVISNYRKNMLIHPNQNRGLSIREAARLQSFPDDFIFYGTLENKQQQIGNAVPPLLAKVVFDSIIKHTQ